MTEKESIDLRKTCLKLGCNKESRFDGFCSDECKKEDREEHEGFIRIQKAIEKIGDDK